MRVAHDETLLIFCCGAEPDVRPTIAPVFWQHLRHVFRSLGKQEPIEFGRFADQRKEISAPFGWHLVVKDISERGAEDARSLSVRRFRPSARQLPIRL